MSLAYAMPKHKGCHKWIGYLAGWVQDHFSQDVPKFGFGDEKMYMKRRGPTPFFPRSLEVSIR